MSKIQHLSTSEVARQLGVCAERVRQLAKSGALPYQRTGAFMFFRAADVADLKRKRMLAATRKKANRTRLEAARAVLAVATQDCARVEAQL